MPLKITQLILLLLVFDVNGQVFAEQNERLPRFSDYSVEVYTGKHAVPKGNDKNSKELKKQIQSGEMFAGHYVISYFPAGSLKYEDFIIFDVLTGEVIKPTGSPAPYDKEVETDYFWPNSQMLVVNRDCSDLPECQNNTSYYLFENNKFILLKSIDHDFPLDDSEFETED